MDAALLGLLFAYAGDGRTLAQGALGWIWAHDPRTVPLPGSRNPAQVSDNAGALAHGPPSPGHYATVQAALGRPARSARADHPGS